MLPLSARTRAHLHTLFEPHERPEAERLLVSLEGDGQSSERLRLAALRASGGALAGLHEAIALAREDWRDLLMAADFGADPHAHTHWRPRPLSAVERDAWRAGVVPDGVSFAVGARVRIEDGRPRPEHGTVIDLLAFEPRIRLRVRTDGGVEVDTWQAVLAAG